MRFGVQLFCIQWIILNVISGLSSSDNLSIDEFWEKISAYDKPKIQETWHSAQSCLVA
jgi:hypothetical protein